MPLDVERCLLASHELGELIVNYLDHQLLRLQGVDYVLTYRFLFYSVGEGLSNLVVDISLDKSAAHFLEGLGNVDFGDFSFAFQNLERSFKSFTQIFKHKNILSFKCQVLVVDKLFFKSACWWLCRGTPLWA